MRSYADWRTRSCSLCRRRKLRCNRENPCSNCMRSRNGTCVYEDPSSQLSRKRTSLDQQNVDDSALGTYYSVASKSSTSASKTSLGKSIAARSESTTSSPPRSAALTPASIGSPIIGFESVITSRGSEVQTTGLRYASTTATQLPPKHLQEAESIKSQINQLEERLSRLGHESTQSIVQPLIQETEIQIPTAHLGGTLTAHAECRFSDQDEKVLSVTRNLAHKNRLFGQSHWVNGATLVSMRHTLHLRTKRRD